MTPGPHAMLEKPLTYALAGANVIAGVAVLLCSALAAIDTVGLWLFNRPMDSVVETSQVLLIVIAFLGMGAAERHGDHIAVTLVRDSLPRPVARVVDAFVQIISILVYAGLAWAALAAANSSLRSREFSEGVVTFPIYPFKYIMVAGLLLTVIAAIFVMFLGPRRDRPFDTDGE